MLRTYFSNRLEWLANTLADRLAEPTGRPLQPDIVLVQSNGMARWLAMSMAERHGISANIQYPLPAVFIWRMTLTVLGTAPDQRQFDKSVLTWRLMSELQRLDSGPLWAPLIAYIESFDGNDQVCRFELARRIADVMDQYLVYRPDWIEQWEAQPAPLWQAALWQRLAPPGSAHRVRLQQRFAAALTADSPPPGLPSRIAMIGISALPPAQLALLAALAKVMEVSLFLLNPCQEYWGDIEADRDIARRGSSDPGAAYLTVGNPLLASLGKQGRDFIDLVQEYHADTVDHYQPPAATTLLGCLQADILNLAERGVDPAATPLGVNDRSLQVHACHSAVREVEVLQDQLLELLQQEPTLKPHDIVVMTPDIEAYSPVIEAVFGTVRGDRRIPYTIADRSKTGEFPLLDTFLGLLDLPRSRYQSPLLLRLLESAAVRRRFSFGEDDLGQIGRWLEQTSIRWGIDADDRAGLDLPDTAEHTWRQGMDRLLLGYALPDDQHLFREILPYSDIEGSSAELMGRWQSFVTSAIELRNLQPRSATAWGQALGTLLETFFLAEGAEENHQLSLLRTAIAEWVDSATLADYQEDIPLDVVCAALAAEFRSGTGGGGFFSGAVTFCTMVPMRSIPFAVVCLIGMNGDSYPRSQRQLDFDLMSGSPRKGDRSRRQDDRYLFLEALLSARSHLYLSYVGFDRRDNTRLPPSVLISELLDTVARGFTDSEADIIERLVTAHPLQPFSRRYFDGGDPRLFSYSAELGGLSRHASAERRPIQSLFHTPLPPPPDSEREVPLDAIAEFLGNPVRFLLRERLGISLTRSADETVDHEPFVLDGLERYSLRSELVDASRAGLMPGAAEDLVRAAGKLPHGALGSRALDDEWRRADRFAAELAGIAGATPSTAIEVDLQLAGFHLYGSLQSVTEAGYLGYRPAAITPKDRLMLWLRHVVLNAVAPAGVSLHSRWLGQDQLIGLQPLAAPRSRLEFLLDCYWQGLQRPLPLFPKAGFAYALAIGSPRGGDPKQKARTIWQGASRSRGEGDDSYYRLAYRGIDPLNDEFFALAAALWQPLLESTEVLA